MRFDCDKWRDWRPWFAWYPVRISQGDCRWFEVVERRRGHSYSNWFYRSL